MECWLDISTERFDVEMSPFIASLPVDEAQPKRSCDAIRHRKRKVRAAILGTVLVASLISPVPFPSFEMKWLWNFYSSSGDSVWSKY